MWNLKIGLVKKWNLITIWCSDYCWLVKKIILSLFFEDFHQDLINTLKNILKLDGVCYIVCPNRGGSMHRFLDKIENILIYEFLCKYLIPEFD